MRGFKDSLLSGAAGLVGLCLALLVSAIWGCALGLIVYATDSLRSNRPQTWTDVAMGWAVLSAAITFFFETPLVRWTYRFMDGLQSSFGAIALIVVLPVHLALLLGRVCLSFIPVKILSMILERYAEKTETICQYAGVVTASQEVRLQDVVVHAGDEIVRIRKDWKIYRHDSCFGWVDRRGRIFKDSTVQHRIIDPDIQLNVHPSGVIDDKKVYISNTFIGTILPD